MTNKTIGFFQKYETRVVRLHLAIIGYLTYSFSTIYFGQHPWEECLTIDKIISVVSLAFILQHIFLITKDLPSKLRSIHLLSVIVFIYIHFIK